jgi:hypothetical protein
MRIAMKVKTTGWIGFGIAETTSGSMHGSDILVASVSGGKTELKDMYALKKETPTMDDCQSWQLISGEESNGITTVEAKRRLNTNDTQDRPFEANGRIVVAFGTTDQFLQHKTDNRKAIAIQFWGDRQVILPKTSTRDFMNKDYVIPSVKTTYYHLYFDANFTKDVSVVAIEQVVVTKYVHHFIVYAAPETYPVSIAKARWEILWAWAPGMDPMITPNQTGFTFGPSQYRSLRLEIHYDNPANDVNQTDSSGVRLYFEDTLRPIENGVLLLGDPTTSNSNPIESGEGTKEIEYDCPSACTSTFKNSLNVWGNFLHMHQIGTQIWGRQWRNGSLIRETNRIDFWDFGLQQMTPKDHTIEPGDRMSTHCVYQRQSSDVPFGLGSDQEMCVQFVYYHPKVAPGAGVCGFISKPILPSNATFCIEMPVMNGTRLQTNPTQLDPVGGDLIEFGRKNPNGFFLCIDR